MDIETIHAHPLRDHQPEHSARNNADDWQWITQELWSFFGELVHENIFSKRQVLAGGESGNGIELLRRYQFDHEGGGAVISLGSRRSFVNVARCQHLKDLTTHADDWWME